MKLFSRKTSKPEPAAPDDQSTEEAAFARRREDMVRHQIEARGITNPRVLQAMRDVPRHAFVHPAEHPHAYEDGPLPIGLHQTISQPYIVALMTDLLEPGPEDVVLEIGTGCGYQCAILARLVAHVYSIERHRPLADTARENLARLGVQNATVICGDGYDGWPELAPYDGIIVTAAPPAVPPALVDQLKMERHLVIPVGTDYQDLLVVTRTAAGPRTRSVTPVRFVPLLRNVQGDEED